VSKAPPLICTTCTFEPNAGAAVVVKARRAAVKKNVNFMVILKKGYVVKKRPSLWCRAVESKDREVTEAREEIIALVRMTILLYISCVVFFPVLMPSTCPLSPRIAILSGTNKLSEGHSSKFA
jgi:hypothetical protein